MQNTNPTHTELPTRLTSPLPITPSGEDLPGPKKLGEPIASCLLALEQLHQKEMALGEAPAAPFTDFLEFQFVKWMVEQDISQGSQDRLIKLPLVSEIFLKFS